MSVIFSCMLCRGGGAVDKLFTLPWPIQQADPASDQQEPAGHHCNPSVPCPAHQCGGLKREKLPHIAYLIISMLYVNVCISEWKRADHDHQLLAYSGMSSGTFCVWVVFSFFFKIKVFLRRVSCRYGMITGWCGIQRSMKGSGKYAFLPSIYGCLTLSCTTSEKLSSTQSTPWYFVLILF